MICDRCHRDMGGEALLPIEGWTPRGKVFIDPRDVLVVRCEDKAAVLYRADGRQALLDYISVENLVRAYAEHLLLIKHGTAVGRRYIEGRKGCVLHVRGFHEPLPVSRRKVADVRREVPTSRRAPGARTKRTRAAEARA